MFIREVVAPSSVFCSKVTDSLLPPALLSFVLCSALLQTYCNSFFGSLVGPLVGLSAIPHFFGVWATGIFFSLMYPDGLPQTMSVHSMDAFVRTPSVRLSQQWRDNLHHQSSNASNSSVDTVQRTRNRQLTPISVRSLGSVSSSPFRIRSENVPPPRIFGRQVFHSADDASLFPSPVRSSKHSSHKSSWGNDIALPPRSRTASALVREAGPLDNIDLNSPPGTPRTGADSDKENQESITNEPRLSFETAREEVLSVNEPGCTSDKVHPEVSAAASTNPRTTHSFKRWISHLRPHPLKHRRPQPLTTSTKRWPIDDSPLEQKISSAVKPKSRPNNGHRKTGSRSSAGLVDAVKAVTMARPTSTPVSRRSRRSNLFSRSNRSSKVSEDQARLSFDQSRTSTNPVDDAARERMVQRQKTLEELVESEASYVGDLKVLIHVREPESCLAITRLLTSLRLTSLCWYQLPMVLNARPPKLIPTSRKSSSYMKTSSVKSKMPLEDPGHEPTAADVNYQLSRNNSNAKIPMVIA